MPAPDLVGHRTTWLALLAAFVAGAILGAGACAILRSFEARPAVAATGRLDVVPPGPVDVVAETVTLGRGFRSHHQHGGPTFNVVVSGRVRITEEDGTSREYGPGGFFFEPAGRPHTIEVRSDVRLDVVRLLPPGAVGTTELP